MDTDDIEQELTHPHLTTVIVLVVTVVLGFAIAFTLRHSYAATKIIVKHPNSETTGAQSVRISDADQYVAKFFKEYSAAAAKSESLTVKKQIVAKYGTYQMSQYYVPPKGFHYDRDPIFCSTSIPTRAEISGEPSKIGSVDATVSETFNNGQAKVIMVVAKQPSGGLKIERVYCSPPVAAHPD